MRRKRLGEVLHERGKISAKDLEKALEEQQQKLSHLGELLLERGLVGKPDLIAALEEESLVPYVDIATTPVDPAVLQLISREVAERLCVLPIRRDLSRLVVVMSDPRNPSVLKELGTIAGMTISPRLAFHADLREAIVYHYSQLASEAAAAVASWKRCRGKPTRTSTTDMAPWLSPRPMGRCRTRRIGTAWRCSTPSGCT